MNPARFRVSFQASLRGQYSSVVDKSIRLIRSDHILNLFGEKLLMPEDTVYRYVVAQIHVRAQQLVVTCGGEIVHEAAHPIR